MRTRKKDAPPNIQQPDLYVSISLFANGTVEIDPKYNKVAIAHLDELYQAAQVEDYDPEWPDDHKVAFFVYDAIENVLTQWGPPIAQEEVDGAVGTVPHIRDVPVRDRFDIANMETIKPKTKAN